MMSAVFGGMPKMLSGKTFPQNVGALRLFLEEVLRNIIKQTPITCKHDLILEELASRSKTTMG